MKPDLRIPVEGLRVGRMVLSEENARYALKVHRKRVGDALVLFDPSTGTQVRGIVIDDHLNHVVVEVQEQPQRAPTFNLPLTLIQALGKGDKPEQAVRDSTAFGAEEVYLVDTARGASRARGGAKEERLVKVAVQVARQCGRADLPVIHPIVSLKQALLEFRTARGEEYLGLVCAFHETSVPLLQAAAEARTGQRLALAIGPEGGFNDSELELLLEMRFRAVSLGPYVLRTEIACGAALAVLRAHASVARPPSGA